MQKRIYRGEKPTLVTEYIPPLELPELLRLIERIKRAKFQLIFYPDDPLLGLYDRLAIGVEEAWEFGPSHTWHGECYGEMLRTAADWCEEYRRQEAEQE